MNWLKTLGLPALTLLVAATPLAASSYVQRINSGSSFGFTSFGSYSYPAPGPSSSSPASTLQTSSCLYNACGGSAPGAVPGNIGVTSAFVPNANSQNYLFTGLVSRYSVFGMYNFRPGTFGSTQQPVFSGGLGAQNIVADPLANPEPTTVALFGAGLLALGWVRRRSMNGRR